MVFMNFMKLQLCHQNSLKPQIAGSDPRNSANWFVVGFRILAFALGDRTDRRRLQAPPTAVDQNDRPRNGLTGTIKRPSRLNPINGTVLHLAAHGLREPPRASSARIDDGSRSSPKLLGVQSVFVVYPQRRNLW
jgi:hypothetical protein